jgi:hypothetical protein
MFQHEQNLAQEKSVRSAQQGGRLVYRADGEHSWWIDNARSALYGPSDPAAEKRLQDHKNQLRFHPEFRTGITTVDGAGGYVTLPYWDESHFIVGAHALSPLAAPRRTWNCRTVSAPSRCPS